jgi:hypothetical protein
MKKIYLLIFLVVAGSCLQAQTLINEQYASSVIGFSSEYGASPGNYSAAKALGAPNAYPVCSDSPEAWLTATINGQREFLVLGFSTPQPVSTIRIYQNVEPGTIDTVYLRESVTNIWHQVYVHTASEPIPGNSCPGLDYLLLEIKIPVTSYNADAVRIALNSPAGPLYWKEIDAVSIANFDTMPYEWQQSAGSVIAFSTEYGISPASYSAAQALGSPSAFPTCGDYFGAWASQTSDGQREYLVLGYTYPSQANRLKIYQNNAPGAIDTVYLREAGTGIWHNIYSTSASIQPCPQRSILELNFTKTTYNVDAVRVAVNSPVVPSWNEIDAIELQSNLPPGAKFSVQSGNWNNISTWAGGIVPGSADTIVIGNGHNVTVDANVSGKTLFVNTGGTLTVNSANTLTLGPSGGGKEYLQVQGNVNISNGTIAVNGNVEFQSGSSFTMSGGNIIVDGNDGTAGGSVISGTDLFALKAGMSSCSVTGGTITIVDPQYNALGQAISGSYAFGAATTLKLGNGISTTASNNTNGFGGGSVYPAIGNLVIDAALTTGNRHFANTASLAVAGNCTVTSGKLKPAANMTISGNLVNNATIEKTGGSLKTNLDCTNNGTITVAGGSFSIVNNFTNNTGAIYNVTDGSYTSVGDDVVNDGTFTSGWLYMANDFGTSSNAQTIGGAGTFTVYGIEPHNNNASGVSLLLPMTVQQLYFPGSGGKLFIGNNNLTLASDAYGIPGSTGYVVMNGTGKLIINNIAGTARTFPIGTAASYTPITIVNGSGHIFSATVKSGFTFPPNNSAVVNREWNITDVTGGAVSADITFQWNAAEEDGSFNRALSQVGHHNGSAWQIISSAAAAGGSNPYTRTATGVSSFSPFGVGCNGALPVTWLYFKATPCDNKICLQWATENETSVAGFVVERSKDGQSYQTIANVNAVNSSSMHVYDYTDINVEKTVYFYRIRQVDRDNKYSYSKTVRADLSKFQGILIYPNPATDEITLQANGTLLNIQLFDLSGKMIKQFMPVSDNRYKVAGIETGMYMLRINRKESSETIKLFIE